MGEGAPRSGGCLCGAVRFTATPKGCDVGACHCGMCRRWSGGVFLAMPCGTSLKVADEMALGIYPSSDYGERVFCRTCGSSLFWRMRDGSGTVVSMQAFDDATGFVFAEEIFIDEKPAAYEFANPTVRKTGAQVIAAFAAEKDA